MNLWQTLGKRTVLFDGGMGTLLQAKGLKAGESPVLWTLRHPEVLREIHSQYLEAGCDVVTTNTFGANRLMLPPSVSVSEVVGRAVALAKEATQNAGRGAVALDIGPTGRLLAPYGNLPFEEAVSVFGEMVRAGAEAGADLILMETFSDSYEIKAAVLAAKENASLPILVTMMFGNQGKLMTGADVRGMVAMLEDLGVSALGCNCGFGPSQLKDIAAQLLAEASVPVIVNPNAGLPEIVEGQTRYKLDPEVFAAQTAEIAEMGAWMVGGCCGTTPAHIAALHKACVNIRPKPIAKKETCVVSSWGRSVSVDKQVLVIGERINPTGKQHLLQAFQDRDVDAVLDEALEQQAQGAQALDFNLGAPGLDEAALFEAFLPEVQAVTDLPIQIDTANAGAMERALRLYNGKPLINSVSGKLESMEAVFPLAKRYGGVLVALLLDESGIPQDVPGRLAIAEKICAKAMEYGIERKDLLIDALTLPIAVQEDAAAVTLETVRQLREKMGLRTILGISNISYGLPQRAELNAAFLTMAIHAGLSAAILNPGSPETMQALRAASSLVGRDARSAEKSLGEAAQ